MTDPTTLETARATARHEGWERGYRAGHSRAMRYMSDEPSLPHAENPYPAPEPPVGPDCRAGKHEGCAGTAFDFAADIEVPCACCAAGHDEGTR